MSTVLTLTRDTAPTHRKVERRKFTSGYADRVHYPHIVSRVLRTMLEQYPVFAENKGAPDIEFDTLVGTGLSGALIVPALARSLKRAGWDVDYLLVRKDNDGTHSSYKVEGSIGDRWLFVDDLIATGKTLSRCIRRIHDETPYGYQETRPQLAGVFLYGNYRDAAGNGNAVLHAARQKFDEYTDSRWFWEYDHRHSFYEYDAFEYARPRMRSISGEIAA